MCFLFYWYVKCLWFIWPLFPFKRLLVIMMTLVNDHREHGIWIYYRSSTQFGSEFGSVHILRCECYPSFCGVFSSHVAARLYHLFHQLSVTAYFMSIFNNTLCFYFRSSELICTECLNVRDVTSHSAVLHWQPILTAGLRHYELQYGETERNIQTSRKLTLSPHHTWTELTDLQPDTHYSVRLTAHILHSTHSRTLSAGFTTLPGEEEIVFPGSSFCH